MPRHKRIGSINTRHTDVEGDSTAGSVKLYDTVIVRWNANNVILDHGGHETPTTCERMNATARTFGLCFLVSIVKRRMVLWPLKEGRLSKAIPWPPDSSTLVMPRALVS